MNTRVELFFDFRSPYSYLAFTQLRRLDLPISLRPMQILEVMKQAGNVPTTLTCAAKGRYAEADLARWGNRLGVTFRPSDMRANDGDAMSRAVIASAEPDQAAAVAGSLFRAIWTHGRLLVDNASVITAIADEGLDTSGIADRLEDAEVKARLEANTAEAVARGVFGAPTMYVGETMFFGNDRVDWVREELDRLEAAA